MNLIDCTVEEVLMPPYWYDFGETLDDGRTGCWCVRVRFEAYGVTSETMLTFNNKSEADGVKPGFVFQR